MMCVEYISLTQTNQLHARTKGIDLTFEGRGRNGQSINRTGPIQISLYLYPAMCSSRSFTNSSASFTFSPFRLFSCPSLLDSAKVS